MQIKKHKQYPFLLDINFINFLSNKSLSESSLISQRRRRVLMQNTRAFFKHTLVLHCINFDEFSTCHFR